MSPALADAGVLDTRVVAVERDGDYRVLSMHAPEVARRTEPGQFVMLSSGSLLRRPFSVFHAEGETVSVAFDVVGEGTRWLASRSPGDAVSVVGPLGTAFALPASGPVLAIGGGYGAAPLFLLARALRPRGIDTHAILGAARASRVFGARRAESVFDSVVVTTEDGSLGIRGRVTDALGDAISRTGATRIAACGPMPMLGAVAAAAGDLGIACEVAVEEFMACGIGVCWTCVVPTAGPGETRYVRSCTEGPVFDGSSVSWG